MTNLARGVLALLAALGFLSTLGAPAAAQEEKASVRVIHAVSDLGPIDVYIDDALAVVGATFPSVTDPLLIDGGDHRVTVTPSGYGMDQALIDSVIAIEPGTTDEIAVVGTALAVGAVLFPMDRGELDEDRGRIRIVHASPDAGPLDPIVASGDQLFPTVQFQQATEYAEAPLGPFPLAMLFSESRAVALDLPMLTLDPGSVTDLYIVGRIADGTIQPVIVQGEAQVVPLSGYGARLLQGACVENGPTLQDLGVIGEPRGRVVGSPAGEPVNALSATVPVSFDQIVGAVTSIEIRESEKPDAPVAACAEIGGLLADDGALAVALRSPDGGSLRGVAVIAQSVLDPAQTDVSLLFGSSQAAAAPDAQPTGAAPAATPQP
ncbi:MAG: DUF4397 domain-containing protein [Chloroflexota bacterium]